MTELTREEKTHTLLKMIDEIGVAMMTTIESDGSLRARPMWTRQRKGDRDHLYCFSRDETGKLADLERDAHVNLSYANKTLQDYASVSGMARTTRDAELISELWAESMRAWFPGGPEDNPLVLIEIALDYAEYWDAPSATMIQAYGWAKAQATGEPVTAPGENEKIDA